MLMWCRSARLLGMMKCSQYVALHHSEQPNQHLAVLLGRTPLVVLAMENNGSKQQIWFKQVSQILVSYQDFPLELTGFFPHRLQSDI